MNLICLNLGLSCSYRSYSRAKIERLIGILVSGHTFTNGFASIGCLDDTRSLNLLIIIPIAIAVSRITPYRRSSSERYDRVSR